MVALVQMWRIKSQLSLVQASPSPQSPSDWQQPATAAFEQLPVATLHESVVQGLPSPQAASAKQHAGCDMLTQVFDPRSQLSLVQTLESPH